ncbi:MAG: aromatic ring-hydroxylating dioxygenase subunit alpha [Acidimicrobiales bacterium]
MFSQTGEAAPIGRAGLEASLRPFGESRMLPRVAYLDAAVFAWEQEHFFSRGWVCVALGADVAEPGDHRGESLGAWGVLLTRDDDGQVHAFANACRHRGHELVACGESAHGERIICPYHAWTYDLKGNLKAARGFIDAAGFDASAHGLVELPAEEWAGLVFVDASKTGEPLRDRLGTLDALVAPYEPGRLKVVRRHTYDAHANWKILTENYHECYHCPMIHPQFCDISSPRSGENYAPDGGAWVGGWMEIRDGMSTMSLDGTSRAAPLRGLAGHALRQVIYANVFPNILLSLHPDYVMTHRLTPLAPDRTRIECTWAFAPESVNQSTFDPAFAVEFWDMTNEQDWRACESVQRGLSSPHAIPGPLSQEEDAVYQFVTMIARAYLGGRVRTEPAPAMMS